MNLPILQLVRPNYLMIIQNYYSPSMLVTVLRNAKNILVSVINKSLKSLCMTLTILQTCFKTLIIYLTSDILSTAPLSNISCQFCARGRLGGKGKALKYVSRSPLRVQIYRMSLIFFYNSEPLTGIPPLSIVLVSRHP